MLFFHTSKTLDRLDSMLEDAINGTFTEEAYDETRLSRLESKWKQYLSSSHTSLDSIRKDRENIKGLVADISHQTKTPLANILLYSQLLEEQITDGNQKELVRQISFHAQKLDFLIQALVKISRLESGAIELSPKRQPVIPLIRQAVRQADGKAAAKNIDLFLTPFVSCDASFDLKWTQEALFNLLDNAIKYSPDHSRITVTLRSFELYACISVSDQGQGVSEEERALIFQRFYRSPSVSQQEGAGIGLYLTRMILQKEQGYVTVHSNADGGSTFCLYLKK